jgi:hypothetical protein
MEMIEMIEWLALGFVPMFGGLHIMGEAETSKPHEKMTLGEHV